MKRESINDAPVPNWPELAVARVWGHAKQFPEFNKRIPDEWDSGASLRADRKYFYGILRNVSGNLVSSLIEDCKK